MNEMQKKQVADTLRLGCPLETAVEFAGVDESDVREALLQDAVFARQLLQAAAIPEIVHMTGVRKAAEDVKNWRASVWWLERCLPQKYGRRQTGTVTEEEFDKFVTQLVELVDSQVHDTEDQHRLLAAIHAMDTPKLSSDGDSLAEDDQDSQ